MSEEAEHEHNRTCFGHDRHWMDDEVYVRYGDDGAPVHDDAPNNNDLLEILQASLDKEQLNYRFALVIVNEKGGIQCATNPGATAMATMNLLARAVSIMAMQHDLEARETSNAFMSGLGDLLRKGVETGAVKIGQYNPDEMPDVNQGEGTGQYL